MYKELTDYNVVVGRNYGAVTCETCKAFFRRVVTKDYRHLDCHLNGKCIITTKTRKCCQKCRLDKCFAVGMKLGFIRSEEENNRRRQVGEEKRKRLTQMTTESDSVDILSKRDSSQEFNDNTGDEIEGLIDISLNISDEELNEQILEIKSIVENDIQIQYKSYENRLKQEFMKWSVVP
ncbi:unnamed protein product, partial [Oppiella nova]